MPVNLEESNKARKRKSIARRLAEILILAALLLVFFVIVARGLKRIAVAQIAELTNTKIEAESVDFDLNGSVLIKNLIVRPNRECEYQDAILKAKTVYACFNVWSLLLFRPNLKQVQFNDFVFEVQCDLDTRKWNVAALQIKAPKSGAGKMPAVRLERGMVQYSKVSNGLVKVIAAVPVDATFGFDEETQEGYKFEITTGERTSHGNSRLSGYWKPGRIAFAGGISSADVPAFERSWTIDVLAAELKYDSDGCYSLKAKIKNLLTKQKGSGESVGFNRPAFLQKFGVFAGLEKFFGEYQPWGRVDIDIDATGNLKRLEDSKVNGRVYCKDVAIRKRTFPYIVEHMAGVIDFNEKGISFENLTGRHNQVDILFSGWLKKENHNLQYDIRIKSHNISLDNDLYNALNAKCKGLWSAFSPRGLAAIDYRLIRHSETHKRRTLGIKLLDAEASYRHFPYPLKNLTGSLLFDGDSVTISDVLSESKGRKITLDGSVACWNTKQPIYDISIKAENIPIDSTLCAALPNKKGHIYSKFDMASQYGHGFVSLISRIHAGGENTQPHYRLSLYAKNLELNEALLSLLPKHLTKIVSELQPKGQVNIAADLNKSGEGPTVFDKITVYLADNSINYKKFPYPLKDVTGKIIVTKDSINLDDITAAVDDEIAVGPDDSRIRVSGEVTLTDNTLGSALFSLSTSDIFLDQRLGMALPESFRDLYSRLAPTGRLDLDLENLSLCKDRHGRPHLDFDGTVKLKDCGFETNPPITALNGLLDVKGGYDVGAGFGQFKSRLFADSIRIKGKCLRNVKADVSYDGQQQGWLLQNLVGDCYGGRVTGHLELKQQEDSSLKYSLDMGFDNINLRQFLSDGRGEEKPKNGFTTSGQMDGSVSLAGRIDENNSRLGRCKLQIRNMQVGKLSPLAKVLSVLRLTEPKDYAFEQMFVDSYIRNDKLILEKLDLSGNSVAFNGSGWMDLRNQDIDITLTARGGRLATAEPSVLQSLSDDLGLAVVRMDVKGNYYQPQVKMKTLPVIEETLKLLGTPRKQKKTPQ